MLWWWMDRETMVIPDAGIAFIISRNMLSTAKTLHIANAQQGEESNTPNGGSNTKWLPVAWV